MKKTMLTLWLSISVVVIGLIIWLKPYSANNSPQATTQPSNQPLDQTDSRLLVSHDVSNHTASPTRFITGLEQLPASLAGTDVDGEILIDEHKNLHVTRGLRNFFDYFLSAVGEEPLPIVVDRVKAYIRYRTPEPAQSQTIALFDQYIAYRAALGDIPEAGGTSADQLDLDAVMQQKAAEQRLRQNFFDQNTILAFFGDDDAYDQYTVQSLKIAQSSQLSEAEKAKQTADLLQQLPKHLQDSMQTSMQYQTLAQLTTQWKARAGSAAELHQIRTNLVGPEATQRLEALDQENNQWQTRIDTYLKDYRPIINNPQWSTEQKQLMITSLRRQQGFSDTEQLRLPAFEQMAVQATGK